MSSVSLPAKSNGVHCDDKSIFAVRSLTPQRSGPTWMGRAEPEARHRLSPRAACSHGLNPIVYLARKAACFCSIP
jgi:hypothetical protein